MKAWDDRAAYMSALARLSLECDRESSRAQETGDIEPQGLIAAWERVQVARNRLQTSPDVTGGVRPRALVKET